MRKITLCNSFNVCRPILYVPCKAGKKIPGRQIATKIEYIYDEFGQMTKLPDLSSKMNASPGANILFNLFLQDYGQLKSMIKKRTA